MENNKYRITRKIEIYQGGFYIEVNLYRKRFGGLLRTKVESRSRWVQDINDARNEVEQHAHDLKELAQRLVYCESSSIN